MIRQQNGKVGRGGDKLSPTEPRPMTRRRRRLPCPAATSAPNNLPTVATKLMSAPPRNFSISTLGCKVNQYETEQLAALLRSRGLVQVEPGEQADLRIVNTCSVTTEAAAKSRHTVRRATRTEVSANPSRRVLVTGCWATSDKREAQSLPGVDAVLTHHDHVAAELDRLLKSWQSPTDQSRAQEFCGDEGWIIGPDCTP